MLKKSLTKQLWPYVRPYKKVAIPAFLLSFVLAAVEGARLKLIKPIFDHGLSGQSSPREVYMLAGGILLISILNFPIRFFHFYGMRFVGEKMNADLRSGIFAKLQRLPTSFYNQNKQGRLLSTILNDAEIFAQSFKASIDVIREPLEGLVYLGVAFFTDWQLTLVIVLVGPLFVMIFQISGKKIKANQSQVQEGRAEFTHNLTEGLAGHKVTKAFNLQDFVMNRFKKAQDYYFHFTMKTSKVEELAHPLVEVIGGVAFSLIIVFAYYRIKSGALTTGGFIQFAVALALLMDPIRKYSQANVKLGQGLAAADRINQILDLDEEVDRSNFEIKNLEKDIVVSNITFGYNESPVLKNFNLQVKKGQKIALVGLSGSGKSTLINLLLGLYPLSEGSIKIDGRPLSDIKLKSLRKLFGLVSQDVFLFHDTIRSNLTIGGNFTDEEIRKALEVSYASEFVDKLPLGLETIIGDRGAKLSGGQQQRLTIARAFLQNTDILLFDEATSALDNESEKVVQRALEAIAGNKTVIAVAHRLSTVQDYDRIFVLKDGILIEEGTHAELMSNANEYKKLYELSLKS
ncbi:MAG: ATP-binding cassette domain-containing protein [Rhizobacter sp.]|nr:ATP-binding cassette domain-containing protein [Bacteriovorax sp.]